MIEFTKIENSGVTTKNFDELTNDEKLDLELAVMVNDVKVLCVTCLKVIPNGTGFYCQTHKGKN